MNSTESTESTESVHVTPQAPRSKILLAWMIVSQILGLAAILVLLGLGVFGFLLDGHITFLWFAVFFSPVFMLIPLVASWFAYGRRKEKQAWIMTSMPALYVCLDLTIYASMIFLGW
jgi:hypothetical protein